MKNAEYLIHLERTYSFFQLVKTLDFMGLRYIDLYSKSELKQFNCFLFNLIIL